MPLLWPPQPRRVMMVIRGVQAIAVSHPHFIGTASLWQQALTSSEDDEKPPPVSACTTH